MSKSLISIDTSSSIKGFLIILIVLAHNSAFSELCPKTYQWLYTFHVQSFFILPFLYPLSDKVNVAKRFIRIYYPFIIVYLTFSLIYYFLGSRLGIPPKGLPSGVSPGIEGFIFSFFTGNMYQVTYFSGFQYIWFLPVFFSTMIFKDWYYSRELNPTFKNIILLVSAILYVFSCVFFFTAPYSQKITYYAYCFSPFAIIQGIGFAFPGILIRKLIDIFPLKRLFVASLCIFIPMTMLIYWDYATQEIDWVARTVMPFAAFMIIYTVAEYLQNIKVLNAIGRQSMLIYLIHQPLNVIAVSLCLSNVREGIISVLATFLIVMFISYLTSVVVNKIDFLRKIISPRDSNELLGLVRIR